MAFCFPVSIAASGLTFFPLIGLYLLGGFWTFRVWPPAWGRLETIFAVFWGLSILSAIFGASPTRSVVRLEKDLYFALIILLGAVLRKDPALAPRLMKAMLIGGLLTSAFGLLQYAIGINSAERLSKDFLNVPPALAEWPRGLIQKLSLSDGRVTGLRSHPLTFAESLLLPLAYLLSLLASHPAPGKRFWRKWMPAAALLLAGLLLSQSRGPWIAFAGMVLALGILEPRPRIWGIMGGLSVVAVALLLAVPSLRQRVQSISDTTFLSNSERLLMWKAGARIVKDHPALGVGPGNMKLVSPRYQTPEVHAAFGAWGHLHNTYVNIAAERGLLGLGSFLLMIGWIARRLLRAWSRTPALQTEKRALLLTALLGMVGWLGSGFTESVYTDTSVLMIFYLVLGVGLVYAED